MTHVTDLDMLIADLNDRPPALAVDRAAEALALAAEAAEALAEREDYDTATLWWAAGTLSSAHRLLLPHTQDDPPPLPPGPGPLADGSGRLNDVLQATVDALDRAARATQEPQRLYALSRAADLADKSRRACVNARAAT
ncbi:hypothetical protein KGA66_23460 [Actinocrinis puniceicyclus]|uniref:Uncharacterized protein n=1 Tax=Actinocrinis puniceicyclus TaxID=977794 RepID=A0A8J8BDB1_9ACTN|nr:hypothetical protein [Actinocrinis puniceicyclus]MBS2966022.1 hypothetical protein [Actinocrinis puniceicyclus]